MADRKNRKPQDIGSDSPASKSAKEQHTASVRKGYDAAQDPEPQGDGDPGPDPGPDEVREQSSQQGHGGRDATGRYARKKAATDRP